MSPREPVNILLVDDQPAKLLSLEAILADLGENVLKASSADEALRLLLAHDIAVVLVDVCMPAMDGFQLAELIRDHPRFHRTAIIFISAVHLTDADRLRGYGLGAVDYIPVPIIPEVLRAKVAVFADLHRKTDQLERVNGELQQRVAELNLSNERLRLADRMATIGTLSAGLGHDMGNLLLPIRMRLDTIEACDLPAEARGDIAAVRKACEYLQRLAASLRLLALDPRQEASADCATDLTEWWRETEGMIRNGIPRSVTLRGEFPAGLPPVAIGRAALTQIVFNLVQNAGEVLHGRDQPLVTVTASSAAPAKVRLSVVDNGPGMSDEARRRCLEPFFTTKTRGLSTGLGLALVNGLVSSAGGSIQIITEADRGTTFVLDLPIGRRPEAIPAPPRRGVAVVDVRDRRLSAHVQSILSMLEFEVRQGEPADADIWVTEVDGNGAFDAARRFVAAGPARRVLLFGATDAMAAEDGRLICLKPGAKPSALRVEIQRALSGRDRIPEAVHSPA